MHQGHQKSVQNQIHTPLMLFSRHHQSQPATGSEPTQVTVHGYCELDASALLKLGLQGDFERLRNLRGEYTLILEDQQLCTIITSPVGAMHYFYTKTGRGQSSFVHGRRLVDILTRARLDWAWNWQALGDLCQLENLTDNATLHPDIHRVPPGTVLQVANGELKQDTRSAVESLAVQSPDPEGAIRALNAEVARLAGEQPYLSLSGGFDSRVILSSMLRQGIKPHLITTGTDECSDVSVARSIAKRFGLQHDLVRIELDDFLIHAPEISSLTNGSKPACHWHTYLYPLKAAIPSTSTFFVGTLGEFARSYYFDRGQLGRLGDRFPGPALNRFWGLKLHRHPTFLPQEFAGLTPQFAAQLEEPGIASRASRLRQYCHDSFLPGLTRYYFEQRVPNFYGNGIAMYQASSQWRSPFHNREWLQAIWNLPANWKLGSNWHRFAIEKNQPELLEFSEENGFHPRRMLRKAPPLYWTPLMRRTAYITYDRSSGWYRERAVQDSLTSRLELLDDLVDPATVTEILNQHRSGSDRTRSLAFLLSMAHWKQNLADRPAT
jgi:asparagine synthase (glutamine-hydrolysing)